MRSGATEDDTYTRHPHSQRSDSESVRLIKNGENEKVRAALALEARDKDARLFEWRSSGSPKESQRASTSQSRAVLGPVNQLYCKLQLQAASVAHGRLCCNWLRPSRIKLKELEIDLRLKLFLSQCVMSES